MSAVPIQPCWAWVTQQGNPQSLSLFAHKPNKQLCHGIRPCVHMYNGTWYAAGVRRQTSNSSVGMTTGTYLSTMVFVFNFAAEVAVNNVLIMKCAKRTARAFFPWFSKEKAYSYRIAYGGGGWGALNYFLCLCVLMSVSVNIFFGHTCLPQSTYTAPRPVPTSPVHAQITDISSRAGFPVSR